MTHPVLLEITRGSSFSLDVRFPGEVVGSATAWLMSDEGMPYQEFLIEKELPDTFTISAATTQLFAEGQHDANLWVEWPDGRRDVELRLIFSIISDLQSPLPDLIIDGGAPDTEFSEFIDGGEA